MTIHHYIKIDSKQSRKRALELVSRITGADDYVVIIQDKEGPQPLIEDPSKPPIDDGLAPGSRQKFVPDPVDPDSFTDEGQAEGREQMREALIKRGDLK